MGAPGSFQNNIKTIETPTKQREPENLEICKDAHRNIIEIGLVEILSTSMAFHLVTNLTHHEHS